MKLQNNLNKDIQLARFYRSLATLIELATFYAIVWVMVDVIKWTLLWF